jgi:hypothetical protein
MSMSISIHPQYRHEIAPDCRMQFESDISGGGGVTMKFTSREYHDNDTGSEVIFGVSQEVTVYGLNPATAGLLAAIGKLGPEYRDKLASAAGHMLAEQEAPE